MAGVFTGDIYANSYGNQWYDSQGLTGYKDLIVVFDYENDEKNRELPESEISPTDEFGKTGVYGNPTCSQVTLKINEANTYEAYDPASYEGHYSNSILRYTDYESPINYGTLFGGSDPVRMFAVFYINPNEAKSDSTAVMTVGDQEVSFSFSDIQEITEADEILKVEDDYETAQMIARFKLDMDEAAHNMESYTPWRAKVNADPGSDYGGVPQWFEGLFSGEGASFDYNGVNRRNDVSMELPPFDIETVAGAYPEISEDIRNIAALSNQYASSIVDSSKSCEDIQNIAKSYYDIYFRLTDYFGMDGHYTSQTTEDFKSDVDRDISASEMFS